MEIDTLGVAIAVAKSIPGTAANRAESAKASAEAAALSAQESAELAEQHSFGVSVEGTVLVFTKE